MELTRQLVPDARFLSGIEVTQLTVELLADAVSSARVGAAVTHLQPPA